MNTVNILRAVQCAQKSFHLTCIFVDDIGRNLKPAQALGMRTIKCDVSDASGARALKALSTLVGGQAGPALQRIGWPFILAAGLQR